MTTSVAQGPRRQKEAIETAACNGSEAWRGNLRPVAGVPETASHAGQGFGTRWPPEEVRGRSATFSEEGAIWNCPFLPLPAHVSSEGFWDGTLAGLSAAASRGGFEKANRSEFRKQTVLIKQ